MLKRKKKLLCATVLATVILSTSGYGLIQETNAGVNGNIPDVTPYTTGDHTKLDIGIDIAEEDILATEGLDTLDNILLEYGTNGNGNQLLQSAVKFGGTGAVEVADTITNSEGNVWNASLGQSNSNKSRLDIHESFHVPNGTWISESFKFKTTGDTKGALRAALSNSLAVYKGLDDFKLKFAEDVAFNVTPKIIKVDDSSTGLVDGAYIQITPSKATNIHQMVIAYRYNKVLHQLELSSGYATLDPTRITPFSKGDPVLRYGWSSAVNDFKVLPNSDWRTMSCNMKTSTDISYYDFNKDGMRTFIETSTDGKAYVDEIKLGYAALSNIYRDGVLVHSGYESQFEDLTATDKVKPNKPANIKAVKDSTGKLSLTWDKATDNGTTYKYTADSTSYTTKTKSALSVAKPVTVTSAIKGYNVVVDNSPSTVITSNVITTTTPSNLGALTEGKHYVHIASIDNEGNISDTATLNFDLIAPDLTLTPSTATGTSNQDVTVTVKATDSESGVKSITLPDGTVFNGNTTSFKVTKNGIYTVKCVDNAGNSSQETIAIGGTGAAVSIDKELPVITATYDKTKRWISTALPVSIKVTDTGSGVDKIVLPNGTEVKGDTASFNADANVTYTVKAYDKAGNLATQPVVIGTDVGIDKGTPDLNLTSDHSIVWTNSAITITAKALDLDSGIDHITLPDGTTVNNAIATYKVTSNGLYKFKATDKAGNFIEESINVNRIDVTKPTLNVSIDGSTDWTSSKVLLKYDCDDKESGIKQLQFPDGKVLTDVGGGNLYVDSNGIYKFIVTDKAGNITEKSVEVKCIDKDKPNAPDLSAILVDDENKWRNTDYMPPVKLSATATASGTKEIQYNIVDKATNKVIKDWSTFAPNKTIISNEGISIINFRTISNAGVFSDSVDITVKIDKNTPGITAEYDNSQWAKDGRAINITSSDSLSGVASVLLPDGKTTTLAKATFIATSNGIYDFTVTDNAGNIKKVSVNVDKVDNVKPAAVEIKNTPDVTAESKGWLNKDFIPNIIASETGISSGIKEIQYQLVDNKTGKVVKDWDKYINGQTVISSEGITKLNVKAVSNANLESPITSVLVRIDKTKPVLDVKLPTDVELGYAITASDALSGLKDVTLPDGTKLTDSKDGIKFDKAGDYKIVATDIAGNTSEYVITVKASEEKSKDITVKVDVVKEEKVETNNTKTQPGIDISNSPVRETATSIISDISTGDLEQVKEDIKGLPKTVSYPIVGGLGLILASAIFGVVYLLFKSRKKKK